MSFVKSLRAEVERARRAVAAAQARYDILAKTLATYAPQAPRAGAPIRTRTRGTQRRRRGSPAVAVNKTARLRAIVADAHTSGIAVRDIGAKLKAQRVAMTNNAVSAALSKLKQRHLIVARQGKYYPMQSLLDAELAAKRKDRDPA
jgi:hypothetical protein